MNALFSVGTMNADTDSASEESVKVIQGRVAHGTLYVRLTCPTMDNIIMAVATAITSRVKFQNSNGKEL